MQIQEIQAPAAMKNECRDITLPAVIQQLAGEHAQVTEELGRLPATEWLSKRGRELGNREQELFTTLDVLRRLAQ